MREVFEQAIKRRRLHELTLTSRVTNLKHYGAPVYATKSDIWPPPSADVETDRESEISKRSLDRFFITPEEPPSCEQLNPAPFHLDRLYDPLCDGYAIRLVELLPGCFDDALVLKFHYTDLSRQDHLQYEALSYVWGLPAFIAPDSIHLSSSGCKINLNGHRVGISANLEQAFHHLRFFEKSRLLWADSVCIHQSDVKERGHQVSLMSDIYRHAWRVVVWLGNLSKPIGKSYSREVENICAEHGFGAICDVVNHWLDGKTSGKTASYRIFKSSFGLGKDVTIKEFQRFEMESLTVQTSTFINEYCSNPPYGLHPAFSSKYPRALEEYLRWMYRTCGRFKKSQDRSTGKASPEQPIEDPGLQATPVNASTSAFWQALQTLFSSTWFSRLWVFQEVVLARSAVVRWGHCEIDWRYIGLASAILRTNYHSICDNMRISGIYNAYLMFRMSKMSDLPPMKFDFLRLLQLTRQFDVTDSRDRVFGLLGIQMDDNDREHGNLFLRPNYETSASELWKLVAEKVITRNHDLSILSSVHHTTDEAKYKIISAGDFSRRNPGRKSNLPSWIPRWNSLFRSNLMPWDVKDKFLASEGLTGAQLKLRDDALIVPGVKIGMVVYTLPYMLHDVDLSLIWSPNLRSVFDTTQGLHLLAITLTAGRNEYGSISQDTEAMASDLAAYTLLPNDQYNKSVLNRRHPVRSIGAQILAAKKRDRVESLDVPLLQALAAEGNAERFIETALKYCERRRLFVTENGYLGLGSDTVVEGDILVVLAGGDLPLVLKPGCHEGSTYQLVGDSYVHGLMDGQVGQALISGGKMEGPLDPKLVRGEVFENLRPSNYDASYSFEQKCALRVIHEAGEGVLWDIEEKFAKIETYKIH